jgi:hypothetical protein
LSYVTLGTPTPLTLATDITAFMNGVLIEITATPPGKPTYQIGDRLATAHIGQVSFLSDNGDMEYPQNLSFANQVYVPLTMTFAAGAKVRCVPGVIGTITPWQVNA